MKSSIKNLQDIKGFFGIRTYTSGAVRRSSKPPLPTTTILDLSMRRNERDRLSKELKRLEKRKITIQERLQGVEKEMTELLEKAIQVAVKLRGERQNASMNHENQKKKVLGY